MLFLDKLAHHPALQVKMKLYAHTNVIDTLEVTCTTGNRNRATGLSAYPPNHKTIRSRLKVR